ncbi:MAG: DUF2752 domain-containing protein [Myxococcaceae bacterium]
MLWAWRKTTGLTFLDGVALTTGLGLLAVRFLPLATLPFWGCPLRAHTGWPCPGCGLTRATEAVTHFDLVRAFSVHPLGASVAIFCAAVTAFVVLRRIFRWPEPYASFSSAQMRWFQWGVGAAFALNYAFVLLSTRPWAAA